MLRQDAGGLVTRCCWVFSRILGNHKFCDLLWVFNPKGQNLRRVIANLWFVFVNCKHKWDMGMLHFRHKNLVGGILVSAPARKNSQIHWHFDMSPPCRRHSQLSVYLKENRDLWSIDDVCIALKKLNNNEKSARFEARMAALNSLTTTGTYMHHRFSWASLELNNFANFCPFATFDSSKCS